MNTKPTLQTLPLECLLEILSYVPLPECMFLRSSCSHLKTAVDEHFRTGVRTLPVLLSACYSPEFIALYYDCYARMPSYYYPKMEKISFGSTSGVSGLELWEDMGIFVDHKKYFRRYNYLILFDLAKFDQFIDFISEYLPGITKLALLIDHDDHFGTIPTILNVYRKQLKVLLVDITYRSRLDGAPEPCIEHDRVRLSYSEPPWNYHTSHKELHLPPDLYHSINSLQALEELYFFTKKFWSAPRESGWQFIDACRPVLRQLKVLHLREFPGFISEPSNIETEHVFDELEELVWGSLNDLGRPNNIYPQLLKCIFHSACCDSFDLSSKLPNLREIYILEEIGIYPDLMETSNSLPNLERLHCRTIIKGFSWHNPANCRFINRSIKFLEIHKLFRHEGNVTERQALKDVKECLAFFKGLEKVVFRKPFMELTGNDIQE